LVLPNFGPHKWHYFVKVSVQWRRQRTKCYVLLLSRHQNRYQISAID